jgi:hypothetical protein
VAAWDMHMHMSHAHAQVTCTCIHVHAHAHAHVHAHAHAHVHAHVWGMVYVKDAFGGPAEPPSSLSLHLSLSLSLDTGLSGLPAEVLKSIEGMTLLEARRRVAP